jgi:hypothetical protein
MAGIVTSPLVTALLGEGIPPDTIVVRGYTAAVDPLAYANELLAAANPALGPIGPTAADLAFLTGNNGPGRIYLTGRLDCWIEIDDCARSVVRVFPETSVDRRDASTIWLRARDPNTHLPIRYRVVSVRVLDQEDGWVSGRLVEDYLTKAESNNVVWDEQAYGPTTGKKSSGGCF